MSNTAKTIFLGSCIFTTIVIFKVHEYQDAERKRMREGVYKDIERRANKLTETNQLDQQKQHNQHMLDKQVKLHDTLSK